MGHSTAQEHIHHCSYVLQCWDSALSYWLIFLPLSPISVCWGDGHSSPAGFFLYIFLLEFDLLTYSITPSAHPIKCLLSARYPVTPSPHPTPFPLPLVHFPESGISHVLSPFLIFPTPAEFLERSFILKESYRIAVITVQRTLLLKCLRGSWWHRGRARWKKRKGPQLTWSHELLR